MMCPKCEVEFDWKMAALSRRDNKTKICSECGTKEAMRDWSDGSLVEDL